MTNDTNNLDEPKANELRLSALKSDRQSTQATLNNNYSRFINRVKLILPLLALLLITVIISWDKIENDKIVPIKEENTEPQVRQEIGKNELVNPRFESIDDKGQPFVITAEKAIQENGEHGEMLLAKPLGTLTTTDSKKITLSADKGIYDQVKQSLDLKDNVILKHSEGYDMFATTLNIDMNENTAWSNNPVRINASEGNITAQGVKATANDEVIIFTGPATMIVDIQGSTLNFETTSP
ncbi:MAG: LPS export ABC transporter periplasmic protein LptC [Bdellovibrionales bacterium]